MRTIELSKYVELSEDEELAALDAADAGAESLAQLIERGHLERAYFLPGGVTGYRFVGVPKVIEIGGERRPHGLTDGLIPHSLLDNKRLRDAVPLQVAAAIYSEGGGMVDERGAVSTFPPGYEDQPHEVIPRALVITRASGLSAEAVVAYAALQRAGAWEGARLTRGQLVAAARCGYSAVERILGQLVKVGVLEIAGERADPVYQLRPYVPQGPRDGPPGPPRRRSEPR